MNSRVPLGWRRTCIASLAICVVSSTGCSFRHYPLIERAVAEGRIPELSTATAYTYIVPEQAGQQRYRRVELLQNVSITTDEGSKACVFVFGERRADGQWEIVGASVRNDDGTWHALKIRAEPEGDEVALATEREAP